MLHHFPSLLLFKCIYDKINSDLLIALMSGKQVPHNRTLFHEIQSITTVREQYGSKPLICSWREYKNVDSKKGLSKRPISRLYRPRSTS